jgi:serpin B
MLSKVCDDGLTTDAAISPLSILIALTMLAGGANNLDHEELCRKLGIENVATLSKMVLQIQNSLVCATEKGRLFRSANALFALKSEEIFPDYIFYLAQFNAHLDSSFASLADGTDRINGWISRQTDGMIPHMLGRNELGQSTFALINALLFRATWLEKFNPGDTVKEYPFHTFSSRVQHVEMMFKHRKEVLLRETSEYSAVCLPYISIPTSRWLFIAYLPHEGKSVQNTVQTIGQQKTQKALTTQDFHQTKVGRLGLPKMNLCVRYELQNALKSLGYLARDYPHISEHFEVQKLLHSVAIILDENGTKAAAATVVLGRRSRPVQLPEIIFDRPFVFTIVAEDMDLVLFMGVFNGPSGEEKAVSSSTPGTARGERQRGFKRTRDSSSPSPPVLGGRINRFV